MHCQAGPQHCIAILQHYVAKAAAVPVLTASNHHKCEPSQLDAVPTEVAHIHTPAAQPCIREDQDAYNLANMMWTMLEMQLLQHPSEFLAFMQLIEPLNLQSLASEIMESLCKQVSHSCITQRSICSCLTLQHIT